MKKLLSLAVLCMVLSGCTKGFDVVEPEPTPDPTPTTPTGVTDEDIKNNVQKVFGVTFTSDQDWNSTTNGTVTLNFDQSVKKVAIMALVGLTNDEGEAYNSMTVLNELETNKQSSATLTYDVPSKNEGLYAAFYTDGNVTYQKIEGNTVSMNQAAARTRAESDVYKCPEGEFKIGKIEDSWAAQRGWISGEKLYMLNDDDYDRMKMDAPAYAEWFIKGLRDVVFAYFPNGRGFNNLDKVKKLGYSNDNAYRVTTGGTAPIVISPIYKRDGAKQWGNEVYNSDFYYYYFKPEALAVAADPVAFLQSLPKFKLIPFNKHFGAEEDDVIEKRTAYAALYFGDGTPEVGTVGTFEFPAGYKIGFMVRAKTTSEAPKKQGELYFDGRLNANINAWPNFSSSKLGSSDPRATWLKINNRVLLCWESGTDTDFNDIFLEVEGAVEDLDVLVPEFEFNSYTYCFEDRQLGDYDMNDVVIKATRKNSTTVEYSIVACGAYDKLYVRNINSGVIKDDAEIHSLFGKNANTFINTESGASYITPVTVTKKVDSSFSFLNTATQPYIYDETTGLSIYLSKKGEDPHGIMIPYDFQYPLEKICIKDAYTEFNNWGQNPVSSTDWFTKPVDGKVFSK